MNKYYLIIILLCFGGLVPAHSQPYKLSIQVVGLENQPLVLSDYFGDRNRNLDTVYTDAQGKAVFAMGSGRLPGLYRVSMNPTTFTDLIYNQENIEVVTHVTGMMDSLSVLRSLENQVYFDFLRKEQGFQLKLDLLKPLIDRYPPAEPFFRQVSKEFVDLQQQRDAYIQSVLKKNPGLFASRMIRVQRMPMLDPAKNPSARLLEMRLTYFDYFSFDDTLLLRTDVYTSKAIGYLGLFSDRSLNQEQLEEAIIRAVDVVMTKARGNQRIYEFILDYFTKGFEKYGFDKVLVHMAGKYVAENKCDEGQNKTDLQRRMENYIKLAVDQVAPDFETQAMDGKVFRLSDLKAPYVLLVFWSSDCPHCKDLLPQLKSFYEGQANKKFELVGISLDDKRENWEKEVRNLNLPFLQCADLKGWYGNVAIKYNIFATPTMFLLDTNRKIVAKPVTYGQLMEEISRL